ncbi:hypothetical protein D3C80_1447990 [compost metagenome]
MVDQCFAGFFGRDIGQAFFEPLQLAVPGGQFGRGQRDDLVDLGDFGVGIGVAREDFPDFFVAIGAFEVFLLAEVVQAIN